MNKKNNWRCNSCRNSYSLGKYNYCYECDFDFCETCMKKTYNTPKNYGHPHKLNLYKGNNGYWCDNCKEHGDSNKTRFRCEIEACDFDLCLKCHYSQ